jgi:putative endonuclease
VEHHYYVYILGSKSRTLYIGITSDLGTRIREHRSGIYGGFTADYKVHRLVYYEQFQWVQAAISREKQLKRWRREKKIVLIECDNPTWEDLSAEWVSRRGCKSTFLPNEETAGPSARPLKRARSG